MDDLEATQDVYTAPQTDEELEAILSRMGASRPVRTIGATLSPTLKDEFGNPLPVDVNGRPIYFQANPDYDPNAKPSFDNFRKNVSRMASNAAEGVKDFARDPLGSIVDNANQAGQDLVEYGKAFGQRVETGNSTLQDVFDVLGTMVGAGPATSVATRGVRATVDDLADTSTSRIFLTPGTPGKGNEINGKLDDAITLTAKGVDPLEIKQRTGWELLAGREWVYEIDDSQAQIKSSAKANNVTIPKEFTVPGSKPTGQQRRKAMLEAKRDTIQLKKQLNAGTLTQDEYDSLVRARQDALDQELNFSSEDRIVTKQVPLAPQLKDKGKLSETFYHPELSSILDLDEYTADTNAKKTKGVASNTQASFSPGEKKLTIYSSTAPANRLPYMVHEVQHFVDGKSGSSGKGTNNVNAQRIRTKAENLAMKARSEFTKNSQDLADYLDMYNVGSKNKIQGIGLGGLISNSVVTKNVNGRLESFFSEEKLAENLKLGGTEDPEFTINALKTQHPTYWKQLTDFGDTVASNVFRLSKMTNNFDVYEAELGEVKARLAEQRVNLTPEERANSLASDNIRGDAGLPIDLNAIYTTDEFN